MKRFIVLAVVVVALLCYWCVLLAGGAGAEPNKPPAHAGNTNKTAMCQYTALTNTWATVYVPTSQVGKKLAEGTYPDDTYNYGECLPA